uniref:GFA family protein n=1 Tax=Roseovarius salinarum TaxID=1981892 RepID=UPI000C334EE3|nr:hypothetical protein [Roseovarius salinarum]
MRLRLRGAPLFRALCHCTIRQAFNDAPRADICVFRDRDVIRNARETVASRVHKQPPFVRRGTCTDCGRPAMETLWLPMLPRMVAIPSGSIAAGSAIRPPDFNMFYHRRQADAEDALPKHSGFLSSQARLRWRPCAG